LSEKHDRGPEPIVAGQSGTSVQLLDAEQNKAAAAALSRWFSPTEQPPDSGEINSHHILFQLLHRIYSKRLTGKLQLVFGRVEKALFFDHGQLVFASSSDSQDGLGEVMLRAGALTQSQFEEASTLVQTGQRFGSAIAEMGIYGVEEIIGWVRRQVVQVIASVLDYPAGRYFFFGSPEKNVVPEIGAPIPLEKLLLEAVRKANDLPLSKLAEDGDLRIELSNDPLLHFKVVDLEEKERNLLDKISQSASAKEIVSQSGMQSAEASRALYALLLLGFVVGTKEEAKEVKEVREVKEETVKEETVKQEPVALKVEVVAPVTPAAPLAQEEQKAIEVPSAVDTTEQRTEDFPVQAEEVKTGGAPVAQAVFNVQPTLEEIPEDVEEPKESELPAVVPVPLLKPNMIAREVLVRAVGIVGEQHGIERHLFNEETTSLLVAESGGVIRLSVAVAPGQLLLLVNVETNRELIVQVLRKRAYRPTSCYLELDFVEAGPRFWGIEFSAATALLPKNDKDVETAATVVTAEATTDQPWILPTAPDAGEVQAFRRDVEQLRGKPISAGMLAMSDEARAVAQLSADVSLASPIPGSGDPLSTEAILDSGLDAAGAELPVERDSNRAQWQADEHAEAPQPVNDFIKSLPKSKSWRSMRGSFTPEFRKAILVMGIVAGVLGIGAIGIAWHKHWTPWKSAAARSDKNSAYDMRVASDAPITSAGLPAKSEPAPNASVPAVANGTAAPVQPVSSDKAIEQPASKKSASSKAKPEKLSSARPATKPAVSANVSDVKESVVIPPKLIQSGRAVASLQALGDFERGNVVIDAVVGTAGEVHFISVLSGPPSLRDSAVESLKQYKYEPATRNGQPIATHVTITIHFRFEP
jgi:TonB family protein